MDFTVELSNKIYPKTIILEAKAAFSEYADFRIVPIRPETISLTIKPYIKYEQNSRDIVLSFINYVLDLAANHYLERDR